MRRTNSHCGGWLLLLLTLASFGAAAEQAVIVPSQMCRGFFFVPITLAEREGYPADRTLWFLYDTGASYTMADPDSLERVSGKSTGRARQATLRDATAGRITWGKLRARIQELDHLGMALGREIDGILGYRAFDDYLLTLDYQRGELRVSEGRLPRPDGQRIFDTDGKDSRPWLDVTFSNRTRRMLIDSGAGLTALAVRKLERYDTVAPPIPTGASVRLDKVERRWGARANHDVFMGPFLLASPTLEQTPGNELIGGEVMKHFTWTFDIAKERVRIEPLNPGKGITFAPLVGHGLVLMPGEQGLQVQDVLADSAAKSSGIRPGDIITRMNDQALLDRDCGSEMPRDLTVRVLRDGASLDLVVPATRFVE